MPIYDLTAAAEALVVPAKQLDNILTRNSLHGVKRNRRGVSRRITAGAVVTLQLAVELARAMRIPIAHALEIADTIITAGGTVKLGSFAMLTVDLDSLRATTFARLNVAAEVVGRRRRGRPSTRRRSSPDSAL